MDVLIFNLPLNLLLNLLLNLPLNIFFLIFFLIFPSPASPFRGGAVSLFLEWGYFTKI